MRYKRFDVVELKNDNKATILDIKENNEYFVEIVDSNGTTIGNKIIINSEIKRVVYSK
ncbi:MAG: hypothetical protein HFJ54_09135 [Clostridia bacterium]|nr:hypothetical protein [Clostridia bacterium]